VTRRIDTFCRNHGPHYHAPVAAPNGGSVRVLQNFSITHCDAVCVLVAIRPVADGPGRPEQQGAGPAARICRFGAAIAGPDARAWMSAAKAVGCVPVGVLGWTG